MKARRNSNDEWAEVKYVQLENSDILYKADVMEFQHDTLGTELHTYEQMKSECQMQDHWQDVRERAAIAAMQSMVRELYDGRDTLAAIAAQRAVEYADALVEQLKKKE